MTKICIGMPTTGAFQAETVRWLLGISHEEFQLCAEMSVGCHGYARQRNIVVNNFLTNHPDATHLFFLDDDVVPPDGALHKLLAHDVPVITGVVARWDYQEGWPRPMVYKLKPGATRETIYQEHEAFGYTFPATEDATIEQIDGAGGGCWLIKREVLENMERPWFDTVALGDMEIFLGEDLFFSLRLHEEGIPMYVDWSVRCKHHKRIPLY